MPENREFQEDIPTQIANLERKLDDLSGQIQDQRKQIEERIQETKKTLKQYQQDIQELNQDMAYLTSNVKLEDDIRKKVQDKLQEIDKTLKQYQQDIQKLNQDMTTNEIQVREDVQRHFHGLEGKFDEQQHAQEKLHNDLIDLAKRQEAMAAQSGQQPPATLPNKSTWTGFSNKSLWDWLGIILIPLMIGVFTFVSNMQQSNISQQQHDTDMQIADKQNREAVFADYESNITNLLLNHNLSLVSMNPVDQEARISAQSLTLVTLPRLNANPNINVNPGLAGELKGSLIKFLYNAHLINQGRPIISLKGADLSGVDLSGIGLSGINLSGANLIQANLNDSTLNQAYLWNADLRGATLKNIHLNGAYLWNTNLGEVNLSNADLRGADLSRADLNNAVLREVKLDGANFCFAKLNGIDPPINPVCPKTASSEESGLGDDLTKWSSSILSPSMAQQGKPPIMVNNIANVTAPTYDKDGHALQISLLGGDPYTTLQAYRSVSFASTTTKFDFSLSFYLTEFAISEVPPTQALEFTLSWGKGPIYKKESLQWQQIGDGTSQQGSPPNWRVGNGTDWQYLKQGSGQVNQELMVGKWYTFDLKGEITGNMMRLLSFSCMNDFDIANDTASTSLDQIQPFAFSPLQDPMNMNNQLMNIGIQMDGNAHEDPYDVYLGGVNFQPM